MDWHTVLAGPIVRRVDATTASVWVALAEPCEVDLRVWNGLESAATTREPAFEGRQRTLRVGDNLHVAVVTALGQYQPGTLYSYDIVLTAGGETKNLDGLGFLADATFDGKPSRALGYEPGMLPSFATTPLELTDLRIVHGSCRLPDTHLPDAMVWIDDFIADGRTSERTRPHQLVLSGDQIYADETGALFLALVTPAANLLMGVNRDAQDEPVPKEHVPSGGRQWPCDLPHFPGGWRRELVVNEARMTSIEAESHLLSLGEFCGAYLFGWANTAWPLEFPSKQSLLEVERPPEGRPEKLAEPEEARKKIEDKYAGWEKDLTAFRDGLPFVRRALANVATYMIHDDHDVTDDWNLTALWRERVYPTGIGRTIVRNGLVAYALFQGWGNDPAAFRSGPNKDLLDAIERLCPEGAQAFPDPAVAAQVDSLLGILSAAAESQVRWHYHVDGTRHRLVVIDNRTRRGFKGKVTPPQNIPPSRLSEQIPEGPLPAGLEALVLVIPLVVLGPPVIDELLGGLVYRVGDLVTYFTKRNEANARMPGTWPDAIESWAYAPESLEALLKHLEPNGRVVILSGDLHYSLAQGMTFWKRPARGEPERPPARVAQLVCSALKTQFEPAVIAVGRVLALAQRVIRAEIGMERLNFAEPEPAPVQLPVGETVPRHLRRRLKDRPVLLPAEGWPGGTRLTRPFDTAWRLDPPARDTRPDAERPAPARALPLDPANPGADVSADLTGYRRVAARQVRQLDAANFSRQIVFANTVSVVRFTHEEQAGLAVQQELYSTHPLSTTPDRPEVFAIHSISLDAPPDTRPPELQP